MKAHLNLATHPFESRRRFYVLASAFGILLLVVTLLLGASFARNFMSGRELSRRIASIRTQTDNMAGEQKQREEELQRPGAVDIMDRSRFLNSLIRQKAVSWTQIFMDLEALMPDRVEVIAVRPVVREDIRNTAGPVAMDLQMTVASENMASLVELVRRVEISEKFHQPVLRIETPPHTAGASGGGDNLYQLQMSVFYAQK